MTTPRIASGFTLIETLVYLGLFTIIIGGFSGAAYFLFEANNRNQTKAMLQEETSFLIAKFNWAVYDAHTVSAPSAGASGDTLVVRTYGGKEHAFTISSTTMLFNGSPLSNENVIIRDLVVIHSATTPEYIEMGLSIGARTPQGALIWRSASTTHYLKL